MQVSCDGMELPDGKVMQEMEDGEYLGELEGACMMTKEMKEKVTKECVQRVKLSWWQD